MTATFNSRPCVPRVVLFYRGELRQFLIKQLRDNGEMTSRQLAENLVQVEGEGWPGPSHDGRCRATDR